MDECYIFLIQCTLFTLYTMMMYCTVIRNQNSTIFISLKTSDFKGKEESSDYLFQGFYYYFFNFLPGYHLNLTNALHPRLRSEPGSWETWFQCCLFWKLFIQTGSQRGICWCHTLFLCPNAKVLTFVSFKGKSSFNSYFYFWNRANMPS